MKILIALACLLLTWSQAALGHAALLATSPATGAVLERVPHEIVLTFSEPVSATAIRLFDPQGAAIAVDAGPDATGTRLRITLPASTLQGTYRFSWRVVSAGGQPLGGTLDFSVGTTSALPAAAAPHTNTARDAALWLSRWLTWLCVFAATGAALFRSWNPGSDPQAWAHAPLVAGLVLLPVDLALQGLYLIDASWTALFSAGPWKTALATPYALTLALLALALLAGWRALCAGPHQIGRQQLLAVAGVLLSGIALAASAHAGTAPPRWLSRPVLVMHVCAAIAWTGALIPLYRLVASPRPSPDAAGAASAPPASLAHQSGRVAWAVALLILSGLALAWLELTGPADLLHTGYGNVLLTALILVALVLMLAARTRSGLTPAALAGSASARSRYVRTIGSEIILLIGVLGVVSLWRFTPPPHGQAALAEPATAMLVLEDRRARALIEYPIGAGPWRVRLISIDGGAFDPRHVTLGLSNPAAGAEPIERTMLKQPDGRWRADLPALPLGGQWHVRLGILVDSFDQVTLQQDTNLQQPAPAGAAPSANDAHGGPQHQR